MGGTITKGKWVNGVSFRVRKHGRSKRRTPGLGNRWFLYRAKGVPYSVCFLGVVNTLTLPQLVCFIV